MEQPREPVFYPDDMKTLARIDARKGKGINIPVNVDVEKLDEAIAKANKLVELLKESYELINLLSGNSLKT